MTQVFRCYVWLPVLVCSVLVGAAHPAQARPKVYSVNIGYNSPPPDVDGLDVLQYADDDAALLHGLLANASDQAFLLVDLDRDTRRRYPHLMTSAREPSLVVLQNVTPCCPL